MARFVRIGRQTDGNAVTYDEYLDAMDIAITEAAALGGIEFDADAHRWVFATRIVRAQPTDGNTVRFYLARADQPANVIYSYTGLIGATQGMRDLAGYLAAFLVSDRIGAQAQIGTN